MIQDFTDLKQLAIELKKEMSIESHETLKLEKNSKGYNWEIKLFVDPLKGDMDTLNRLDQINETLNERYGKPDTE